MVGLDKKSRTVLCLGPPHSGKSVFAFILFKHLREFGNDACVMDCDYYSPTYRRTRGDEIFGQDDNEHIYSTPNARKLDKLTQELYSRLSQSVFDAIVEEGVIVLDGIGMHTDSTETLLTLTEKLIVLCPCSFDVAIGAKKSCYLKEGKGIHPFDFYSSLKNKCIKITTFMNERKSSFDPTTLQAELFNLDRDLIRKGNIENIPKETRDTILKIGRFILEKWI